MSDARKLLRRPQLPRRCPATQPVAYFDGLTTDGIRRSSLPCVLVEGHDGHHVANTPDGPYEFPRD